MKHLIVCRTMIALVFVAASLLTPASARAQSESGQEPIFKSQALYGLGLQAGFLSGMGVGFRYHPAGRFGGQLTAGGITLSDRFISSIGLEGQYDFDYNGRSRFYGFIGLGWYSNGHDAPKPKSDGTPGEEERLGAPFRLGAGAAYEISLSDRIVFTPSLAFVWFVRTKEFYPIPQLGLYYYFN